MLTSSGGVALSVCVVPAAPVCIKMAAPLPSFTSTHDFSLNVSRSGASDAAAPGVATVVAGATDSAVGAVVFEGATAAAALFSIGAADSVFALARGLGSAVDGLAGTGGGVTAALSGGRREPPAFRMNSYTPAAATIASNARGISQRAQELRRTLATGSSTIGRDTAVSDGRSNGDVPSPRGSDAITAVGSRRTNRA